MKISKNSVLRQAKNQVSCELDGEAVILNYKKGHYYGLDPIGNRVWALLQAPTVFSRIQETISEEFKVSPEKCEKDLFALMKDLDAEGLIEAS